MKKLIFILFLFPLSLIKGQNLTLSDLKAVVLKSSIDEIDSILRLKGYKLKNIPIRLVNNKSYYTFEKKSNPDQI